MKYIKVKKIFNNYMQITMIAVLYTELLINNNAVLMEILYQIC